jgi:glycosyltransferase involved in cell wall biosynthesis
MDADGLEEQPVAGSVAILLCTMNGARFLPDQLASFEGQDFTNWRLFASDDGSEDGTMALLEEFQKKHGAHRVSIRRGPRRGYVANFLSLICDPALNSDYYALSDQDDIWMAHKLSRARSFLIAAPADLPSLYCSRVRLIDAKGIGIGLARLFRKAPHFQHALVQNIAGGHTMVFNEKARSVLMKAGPDVDAAVHDWWIYQAITAVGGSVMYDPVPTVDYRLHAGNQIGGKYGRVRHSQILLNRFKHWNDLNTRALERIQSSMPEENKKVFDLFCRSRRSHLLPRMYWFLRSGIYREPMLDNLPLMLAALLGKI